MFFSSIFVVTSLVYKHNLEYLFVFNRDHVYRNKYIQHLNKKQNPCEIENYPNVFIRMRVHVHS